MNRRKEEKGSAFYLRKAVKTARQELLPRVALAVRELWQTRTCSTDVLIMIAYYLGYTKENLLFSFRRRRAKGLSGETHA